MEPTLLVVGNASTPSLRCFLDNEPDSTRTVLVGTRNGRDKSVEVDRRILVGQADSASEVRRDWSSGREELVDELSRTDLVLLLTHLDGQPETYLSRYVADLARESTTLTLSLVGGRFGADGLEGQRVTSTRRALANLSDFLLPVESESFRSDDAGSLPPLPVYLGNLAGKVVNRIRHGNDVIGNLEQLVHAPDRSRDLLKRAAGAGQSIE